MVLDISDDNLGTVNDWSIYCIAEDGTETLCGTYDTSGTIRGFEGWINKEVMSIRIVGDPADPTNWYATICLMGPMGTSYVHSTPLPASLSIHKGQQAADLIIDHIKTETNFEITNVLDINLREKVGSELSWVTIFNGATEATTVFGLNPPVGNHKLTLESIDLNSPLSPAYSVLKTDVIDICVYASNQQAFECGELSAASQTNQVSETYEVHSGNHDVTLPIMTNHLSGFTSN